MELRNRKKLTDLIVRAAVFALVAVAALCAFAPKAALAAEYVATVQDKTTGKTLGSYTSSGDAVNAAYGDDKVLVMLKDWNLNTTQGIHGGKSVTIDMNSHRIIGGDGASVFHLYEGASLTLKSSDEKGTFFWFDGFKDLTGSKTGVGLTSGGLVTGGQSVHGGGIYMEDRAKLTLDNVAVAGNSCEDTTWYNGHGGGIYMEDDCTVNIQNNAKVQYNYSATKGGGVCVDGKNATVNITNATICNNCASKYGGGLYSNGGQTKVNLTKQASVRENIAGEAGGGMALGESYFHVISDGTGAVSENRMSNAKANKDTKQGGGGIFVLSNSTGSNEGEIVGVKFEYNRSGYYGGALVLFQEWTKVVDCTFTGNYAGKMGGAVYNNNDYNVISNCTFNGNSAEQDGGAIYVDEGDGTIIGCKFEKNHCGEEGGAIYVNDNVTITDTTITGGWCNGSEKDYEGGGLFVGYKYDVKMTGTCTVKGNTRGFGSGNADDVFLNTLSGGGGKAYITGSLAAGSSVGVRTGIDKADRRIAKNFSYPDSKDCLFMDLADEYFVTYGTDEGGDAWQRYGAKEFELKVNGASAGRFESNTTAAVNATSTDATKVFKCWKSDGTTGLNPFSDYIGDSKLKNPAVSFKMPQNDVDLKAEYVTRTKDVEVSLASPRDGVILSTEGTLLWTSADDGVLHSETVAVSWYKKSAGGDLTLATGKAEADAVYVARVSLAQDVQKDRAFALDIEGSDVKVTWTGVGGSTEETARAASVDASGTLAITSDGYKAGGATFTGVEPISLAFAEGTSKDDFMAALPAKATALKSNGNTQEFEIDWSQIDFSGWFDDFGLLKSHMSNVKYPSIALKDPNGALPEGMKTVEVSFAFTTAAETVAVPSVSPAAGEYKVSEDSGSFDTDKTKMTLKAACATDDAEIKYTLSRSDGSEWKAVTEGADYGSGVDLAVIKGATVSYKLEIWAVKDKSASQHDVLYYTIEDDRKAEMVDVTVKYTDTADDEHHGSKSDDTHKVEKGQDVTLVAPDREGYAFEKWTVDGKDRAGSTLTLESVNDDVTVTAVYNPVVTEIDVKMDAPQAHQALAQAAQSVTVKAAGSTVDITKYLSNSHGSGNPAITWEPEAADDEGNAGHATVYTASLSFESGGSQTSAKYVLAADVAVKCDGEPIDKSAAYIAEGDDGAKSVCIVFPNTGAYEEPTVSTLADINLDFADAWACWKKQDAESPAWAWGLPDQVQVDYKCGESEMYDITWTSIDAFGENATKAQELTARGTIAWPDYVDNDDGKGGLVSNEVTVKINIDTPKTVEAPTASVKSGTHKGTQKVELSCETEGATVRYTTDGSDPSESSSVYDGEPIEVAHSSTIKAKAFCDAMLPSETAAFDYAIKHEVKFDSAGGSEVESQWVVDGEKANEPADPTYKDYDFAGWYTEDGEKPLEYDFSTPVTADLTLVAHWTEKKDDDKKGDDTVLHTVTFDPAGGSDVAAQTVEDGKRAAEPEAPTRKGYGFAGWTLDGKSYDFSTPVKSDLELKAAWKKQESKKDDESDADDDKDSTDKDGSGDERDDPADVQKGNGTKTTTTVTTVTKAADRNLAATGDRTLLIVSLLVILGTLAAAAGIISKRKKQ